MKVNPSDIPDNKPLKPLKTIDETFEKEKKINRIIKEYFEYNGNKLTINIDEIDAFEMS